MALFKQSVTEQQKHAIENINLMISQLKAKKKEWKKYSPRFPYSIGEEYSHNSASASTKDIPEKFEHLMKHTKKMSIKLCSEYISLLKRAKNYIVKNDTVKSKKDLNGIYHAMLVLYNGVLLADYRKELRNEHKAEFQNALNIKKKIKDFERAVLSRDLKAITKSRVFYQTYKWARETDPEIIEVQKRVVTKYAKNWRAGSVVKAFLKHELQFTNYISEIIQEFKRQTDSLLKL